MDGNFFFGHRPRVLFGLHCGVSIWDSVTVGNWPWLRRCRTEVVDCAKHGRSHIRSGDPCLERRESTGLRRSEISFAVIRSQCLRAYVV